MKEKHLITATYSKNYFQSARLIKTCNKWQDWCHVRVCTLTRCTWCQCVVACSNTQCTWGRTLFLTSVCTWIRKSGSDSTCCPETCRNLRSWKSQKSQLFAKSRDLCDFQDFQDFPGFSGFRTFSGFPDFGARIAILAPRSEILVRQVSALGARFGRSELDLAGLAPSADFAVRTRKSTSQVLYIDHFQLPPRWKMTGEEGDRFGGRRWHWPSKPCNFAKNLLITKTVKIAEKGTFFSFTLEKVEKLTIFLPSRSEICRHLRRVVPTAYRPKFRKFWGPEKSKFSHFFWHSGNPEISCPDTNLRKSALSRKVEILAILVSGTRFRDLTYGSTLEAKKSIFSRFSGFSGFLWFLWFFRISQNFRISGLFRKCRESTILDTSELDFWGPKNSRFRTFRTQVSDIDSSVDRGHVCGIICTYFSEFFVCKKIGKIYLFGLNHLVTAG